MLNSSNMMPLFTGPLPVQDGGGRWPRSLAYPPQDCSTSEAFLRRTVLTENICRCVEQILEPSLGTILESLCVCVCVCVCVRVWKTILECVYLYVCFIHVAQSNQQNAFEC